MSANAPHEPFAAVWFDCDSTLTAIEGVDELASFRTAEVRQRVARATERAMQGEVSVEHVSGERLALVAPTREECALLARRYVEHTVPDAEGVVTALRRLGKAVGIVSGGLLPPVLAFAEHLGIAPELVRAVAVTFDPDGRYAAFDADSPLTQSGGKARVLADGPRPCAVVGDGVTDLETEPFVDRFVGFGGIVRRAAVESRARFFVAEPRLSAVLPLLLTEAETRTLRADPELASLLPNPT